MRRLIVAAVVVAAALWLGAMGDDGPAMGDDVPGDAPGAADDATEPTGAQAARVTRVVDGDTIRVRVDGGDELPAGEHRVRLLEVDSPEMDDGSGEPECGAAQATAYLRTRLPSGAAVLLESDRGDADRFGRPLRYVWTPDGDLVNRALVATGNARAVLFPPNDRHWATMAAAEDDARTDGVGIWGSCAHP